MPDSATRVVIIEHDDDLRTKLALLMDRAEGYRCAGAFSSMDDALLDMRPDAADVVLVDLELPDKSGIDGIKLLREQYGSLRLIALSASDADDRIDEAMFAGASGYLRKTASIERLLAGLRQAMSAQLLD